MSAVRVRWFAFDFAPGVLKGAGTLMAAMPYSAKRDRGFQLDTVQPRLIVGRYVERVKRTIKIEDPAGGTLESNSVEIRKTRFRLSDRFPNIEYSDPPRSARPFELAMSEITGNIFAPRVIEISVAEWIDAISRKYGTVRICSLATNEFAISRSVRGTLELRGTQDVRASIKDATKLPDPGYSRVDAEWSDRAGTILCGLTDGARAVVSRGDSSVIDGLRAALADAMDAQSPSK